MKNKPTLGWKSMKQRRHELRKSLTKAEELLWENLKEKRLEGHRFRRQHGIGQYVVDFYHSLSMTIIELDGSIHDELETIENDEWRENFLKEKGYKIIRFKNEEIYNDIDSVLKKNTFKHPKRITFKFSFAGWEILSPCKGPGVCGAKENTLHIFCTTLWTPKSAAKAAQCQSRQGTSGLRLMALKTRNTVNFAIPMGPSPIRNLPWMK